MRVYNVEKRTYRYTSKYKLLLLFWFDLIWFLYLSFGHCNGPASFSSVRKRFFAILRVSWYVNDGDGAAYWVCVLWLKWDEKWFICVKERTQRKYGKWLNLDGLVGWLGGFFFYFSFCFVYFYSILLLSLWPDNARVACKLKIENTDSKTNDSKGLSERVQIGWKIMFSGVLKRWMLVAG